jgi:hypothetical protein
VAGRAPFVRPLGLVIPALDVSKLVGVLALIALVVSVEPDVVVAENLAHWVTSVIGAGGCHWLR